jgi:hypothetical protein
MSETVEGVDNIDVKNEELSGLGTSNTEPDPEPDPEPEINETNLEDIDDPLNFDPEMFTSMGEPEMFGGMLNGILGNYFEYEHGDGNTLNVADILLLIRQSINDHTEAVKEVNNTIKTRLPTVSPKSRS